MGDGIESLRPLGQLQAHTEVRGHSVVKLPRFEASNNVTPGCSRIRRTRAGNRVKMECTQKWEQTQV